MPPRHLPLLVPDDAPSLCERLADGPRLLNSPRHDQYRNAMRRRWLALQHRRMRRLVRQCLAITQRRVARSSPAWRTYVHGAAMCAASGVCRYHMAEFYQGEAPLRTACAVIAANDGPRDQYAIADMIGTSRQYVQQVEAKALARPGMRALAGATAKRDAAADPVDVKVRHILRGGRRLTVAEMAVLSGHEPWPLRRALGRLRDAGVVACEDVQQRGTAVAWWLVEVDAEA